MQKKTLIIIISIAVVAVLAAVYFLFIRGDGGIVGENKAKQVSNTLPTNDKDNEKDSNSPSDFPALTLPIISKIVKSETVSPALSDSGEEINYFDAKKGDFYSIGIDGVGNEALSDKKFTSVKDVEWSGKGDKAIITFKSTEKDDVDKVYVYDVFTKSLNKLNSNIHNATFSPNDQFIVYQYADEKNRVYNISKALPDGKAYSVLKDFYSPGAEIKWDEGFDKIFISDMPSSAALSNLFSLTENGELSKVLRPAYGLQAVFSPQADGILYSTLSPDKKTLSLLYADASGRLKQNLHMSTFASKATISHDGKYAYVAVPTNIKKGVSLNLSDYGQKGLSLTKDQIWRVDLTSGEKVLLVKPEDYNFVVDVRNPFLSHDGKLMFFWDKGDKGIYAVNLAKAEEAAGLTSSSSNESQDEQSNSESDTDSDSEADGSNDSTSGASGTDSDSESSDTDSADKKTPEERLFEQLGF